MYLLLLHVYPEQQVLPEPHVPPYPTQVEPDEDTAEMLTLAYVGVVVRLMALTLIVTVLPELLKLEMEYVPPALNFATSVD